MSKKKKTYHWVYCPPKLSRHDITIDLADIKHFSIRMKQTGKLSRKVLKKWRARDYANTRINRCKNNCQWLPELKLHKWHDFRFMWRCNKCRCSTAWVWEHELSEPLLAAYKEHTRVYDDEAKQAVAEQWAKIQAKLRPSSPDSDD